MLLWIVLYQYGDPNTHRGAFYGNAIADWTGTFLILLVTKFLHEQGSTESRPFEDRATTPFTRFLVCHSLSLFLGICCLGSGWWFWRTDPNSKWGAVAGNLLSQFVQLLGLVLLTKKLFESVPRKKKNTKRLTRQPAAEGLKGAPSPRLSSKIRRSPHEHGRANPCPRRHTDSVRVRRWAWDR